MRVHLQLIAKDLKTFLVHLSHKYSDWESVLTVIVGNTAGIMFNSFVIHKARQKKQPLMFSLVFCVMS